MMSKRKSWRWLSAVAVMSLMVFAACEAESPTSPPTNPPNQNPPVSNPTVSVTVSNRTPQAGGTTQIEVTVTKDGQPVPDGTPVELLTDLGTFTNNGLSFLTRTTVGGKVTATLTSDGPGVAQVAIRVLEVVRRETITFGEPPLPPLTIVLTVSDREPNPGTNTIITATVTKNGQLIEDGTTIEFTTSFGRFTDTQTNITTKTTLNGVATATLTSLAGGDAVVTVQVKSPTGTILGQQSTNIQFKRGLAPVITSITPATASPAGGQLVRIVGENFVSPVQVFFGTVAAVVVSVTPNEIVVQAPKIDLGPTEKTRVLAITVVNAAGTADQASVTATQQFTYEVEVLIPNIFAVSPSSGPNDDPTQITIFGENFQSPVKAFFVAGGSQVELDLVSVSFDRIVAMTPRANGFGQDLRDQQVTLRVVNVLSNEESTLANAFRYGPEMQITSVSPLAGSSQGGTQVTIMGHGFDDPVDVVIGGVVAQPIRVSGTEIVAITGLPEITACVDVSGAISVTNKESGSRAVAAGLTFEFRSPRPQFVGVSPNPVVEGAPLSIIVANAGSGLVRFQIAGITAVPTGAVLSGNETTYSLIAPFGLNFPEIRCGTNNLGRQFSPITADIDFINVTTACRAALDDLLVINPTNLVCRFADMTVAPAALVFTSTVGTASAPQTVTVSNTGAHDLTATPQVTTTCPAGVTGTFAVTPTNQQTIPPASSAVFSVTYTPTTAGTCTGTINFNSNDPTPPPQPHVTLSGTGT